MFKPVNLNENFPEMEKKWLKHWYEKGIVKKYLNKNKDSKKYFSFHVITSMCFKAYRH